jgi:hypothetical protein
MSSHRSYFKIDAAPLQLREVSLVAGKGLSRRLKIFLLEPPVLDRAVTAITGIR